MAEGGEDVRCAEIPERYQHLEAVTNPSIRMLGLDVLDKGLRACLRCSLIKTFSQFVETGCENCDFLSMENSSERVLECTTSYFEGTIAILEPNGSWVAKWQRIGQFEPGMYAIEVLGELPEDAIEHCENFELEYRAKAKQNK